MIILIKLEVAVSALCEYVWYGNEELITFQELIESKLALMVFSWFVLGAML